ncbi:MAG: hypothetical protein V4510_00375 [bacterium]
MPKTVVLADPVRRAWRRATLNLSKMWHRDAEIVRRKAMKAEHKAAAGIAKGWHRLKPRVVKVEHRMHDGLLAALHRLRPHA